MAAVYLGLGSNMHAEENLRLGVQELERRYGQLRISNIYQNAAVGFEGADFLNLVVGLESSASPAEINEQIEAIHEMAGRQRGAARYSSRPLDIDLLLYGDMIVDAPPLHLPRPDVLNYSFVLRPLAELVPDLVHPETGRTIDDHWREFDAAGHPLSPARIIL